jgi:hypothetical protein
VRVVKAGVEPTVCHHGFEEGKGGAYDVVGMTADVEAEEAGG